MDPHSGDFSSLRESMVHDQLIARGIASPRVLTAFRSVSRRAFVRPEDAAHAYEDHPLAIGGGQTISQPYMVAMMLEALNLRGTERVLEIGTGSGYETALLSHLAQSVHTIERIPELAAEARERLGRLGHKNILFHLGDGTLGWPDGAPYDAVIVSAGAPKCPPVRVARQRSAPSAASRA